MRRGGVVAFATETVYGLGADATNERAVQEVFRLKGRPATHPVIVHLPDAAFLEEWATAIPEAAQRLAQAFWPGPLTLVLKKQAGVSDTLTGGQGTVALRVPAHPLALELLSTFGGGVAAPSANRFGHVSPTTAAHVLSEFGGAVPVLDGGACRVGLESTIVDLSGTEPRVLRPGAISAAALAAALDKPVSSAYDPNAPRVPGSLGRHYAPQTGTYLVTDAGSLARKDDVVLSYKVLTHKARLSSKVRAVRCWLTLPDEPVAYARGLYAALRELDALGGERILVEAPPPTPAWDAVRDRLGRAAEPAGTLHHG